jgi:hypothetical protein
VRDGLQHVFERWDGRGAPAGLAGAHIALSARIVVVADIVESFRRLGGVTAAVDVSRRRAGGQFDPALAEHVRGNADALLDGLDEAMGWDVAIAAEPALARGLSGAELDAALAAIPADTSFYVSIAPGARPRELERWLEDAERGEP